MEILKYYFWFWGFDLLLFKFGVWLKNVLKGEKVMKERNVRVLKLKYY